MTQPPWSRRFPTTYSTRARDESRIGKASRLKEWKACLIRSFKNYLNASRLQTDGSRQCAVRLLVRTADQVHAAAQSRVAHAPTNAGWTLLVSASNKNDLDSTRQTLANVR